jgi:ribonuclease HI/exonuclease III
MNHKNSEVGIVQLNCKSILNKVQEIKKLIYHKNPDVVCFNETWLQQRSKEPKFTGYTAEWKHRDGRGGGLGIIIADNLQYEPVNLINYPGGLMETMAIKINVHGSTDWLWILNIYNPGKNIRKQEIKHYIQQLGRRYILMGDLNAHTPILDNKYQNYSNITGQSLDDVLLETNATLINPLNFVTYVDYRTGRPSCLDICLTSPDIAPQATLTRLGDVGSDHAPILVTIRLLPIRCIRSAPRRWKIEGTKWDKWREDIPNSEVVKPANTGDINDDITMRLTTAAENNMKLTSGKIKLRKSTPWWNAECSRRVALRRKAKKKCELHPTTENVREMRKKTAEAKYMIQKSKKDSWQKYVSTLSSDTPIGEVWKKIKAIKSQRVTSIINIKENGKFLETNEQKANAFGQCFQESGKLNNISCPNDIEESIKEATEEYDSNQNFNKPFSSGELLQSIKALKNTSPGHDNIPNSFLKNLQVQLLEEMLNLFNTSWMSGMVPEAWKVGIIIPILKPTKDKYLTVSYRPITLLSTIGKLFEKMICRRLDFFLEKNRRLGSFQTGFRKGLSTIDVLLRLQNNIRQSIDASRYCIAVYLDLKGAYDKVWHRGLLYKLSKLGIFGNMFKWIKAYLSERKFFVRVGNTLSKEFDIDSGVPQGAVLSPVLFNVMLADLPIDENIEVYCYADDISFSTTNVSLKEGTRSMQKYINKIVSWLEGFGMVVSEEKSTMQVFTHKRKLDSCILRIKNKIIPCKNDQRLLGLILDAPHLTYNSHIKYIMEDVKKRLSIMKVISSTSWGACKKVLRNFYIAYVRSKMDYASVIYCCAAPSSLAKLDKLQNVALRLILGARKTSPILSLEVESFIAPLKIRRKMLVMKQYLKLLNRSRDDVTADHLNVADIMKTGAKIPTKSFNAAVKYIGTGLNLVKSHRRYVEQYDCIPPWEPFNYYVYLEMSISQNELFYEESFSEMCNTYYINYKRIFTDGSKIHDPQTSTACGVYDEDKKESTNWKIHPTHSVLAAELFAILQALKLIHAYQNTNNYVLFTDSQSAASLILCATGSYTLVINKIQLLLQTLNADRSVIIQWVKGHSNIKGNDIADFSAKLGHENNKSAVYPLMLEELISDLKSQYIKYWDEEWNFQVDLTNKGTFLRNLTDKIEDNWIRNHKTRRIEVVLSRLRIGHVGVKSHLHRFEMTDSNLCTTCQVPDTVPHFILECREHAVARKVMVDGLVQRDIRNVDLKLLLGSNNLPLNDKRFVVQQLITYLIATNKIEQL